MAPLLWCVEKSPTASGARVRIRHPHPFLRFDGAAVHTQSLSCRVVVYNNTGRAAVTTEQRDQQLHAPRETTAEYVIFVLPSYSPRVSVLTIINARREANERENKRERCTTDRIRTSETRKATDISKHVITGGGGKRHWTRPIHTLFCTESKQSLLLDPTDLRRKFEY